MNYNGNMPDWHQYNPSQSGINDVTSTGQNINSGHFISSISPNCPPQLSSLNLSSEGLEKHQNDSNFNPRHFQPHLPSNISHGHNAVADNTPLASMAQMQNCIGHYGPSNTRNSMVDNLNGPMDPRSTTIGGLNEELGYRNNQVPLNGPISHHGPNVMNMNAPHGSIASRSTNVNSHATGRTGPPPSFAPCKAPCCNPDPNISYQQYCSYQNNAAYRENIRSSAGYQADARRFGNDFSFRKDNFDGKEVPPPPPSMVPPHNVPNVDHRRNFSDPIGRYRKDRLVSRGYSSASSMLQNYSMQNYNYAEYQKYPYSVKDYSKVGGMNVPSQGMVKQHGQEQGFAMPQQKYNSGKQVPYQSNGGMMPSSMPSANVPPNPSMMPAAQNTYYNSQYPRNLSTETSHNCQEAADNVPMANRMQTSTMPHNTPHSRYTEFQQKLAMQRFSIESHLRKLSRIPDYQSLPEYKECVHKYNEIVNIERQQSFTYQGQMQQTAPPCVAVNAPTVPINLQFDRNGVLINSNYLPEAFSRVQPVVNPPPVDSAADKQGKQNGKNTTELVNHNVQKPEHMLPTQQHAAHAVVLCPEGIQQGKQDQYPASKSLDQRQFEVPKAPGNGYSNLGANASDTVMQQKMPKGLDVRQFLANWDESEDEDGASANLPEAVLSDSTPVVVVGYESVDLSAKTLEDLNSSKPPEIASGVITFENRDKSDGSGGVVAAQDCLTISYTENAAEIAKDTACKELAKVRPGSHIIQCISNEPGEAPTIHIVDNLEISSILQVTNGQVGETQDAVSFFQEGTEVEASTIALAAENKLKKIDGSGGESTALVDLASKEKYIVEDSSSSKAAENAPQPTQVTDQMVTLPASMKENLDAAQDINLKKQSSFASEESHNPDDISLPDLPTSECTPISTTLNTPIHSDNEESEHVEDLTIPTNPIEIIQNSPMISFTQSPTKGEPYDHLSDEGTDKRSTDSLRGEYRTETRFKGDGSHNMLEHDAVLGTFEFSANIDESEVGTTTKKNNKERASPHRSCVTANNNEKTFALDGETESVEVTGMRMTLTSGEYELKIMSTGAQSKPRDYKNSTTERHANESQIAAVSPDVSMTRKKLQLLPETSAKVTPGRRYDDSMELNNALQNITRDPLDCGQDDVNYVERRCVSTDETNSASDAASRNTRSEDVCSTKIAKSNSSTSHSTKHSNLSGDKLRKCESDKFSKEDLSLEKNIDGNKSTRTDAKNLKLRHVKLADYKKPASGDPAISHKKRYLSENTAEKCSGEATTHHDKHTQEADAHKIKLCAGGSPKESDVSHNKPKIIDNIRIDDSSERIRLLKEYRRIKYKSCGVGENKSKDAQEASDCAASKKSHLSSNPDERSQSSKDKQLSQRDAARLNLSDEQEETHANILRTFVTKNINPDFDIQVTNVLKLNDNDHPRDSQCLREDAKNGGALDAIKIEINVSCSERNTTKTLLHENIKNAVAETIGHLTSTISNGARSNSTNITEIQCDKKIACDKVECCDYERSPAILRETSTYNNEAYKDQDNAEVKHKAANEEPSNLLISKKRRKSSSERDQINNIYDNNGNVNIETEPASSILETSKTEHTAIRRRSVQQDVEKKVAANFCVNEESKISVDNSYMGSILKNIQKMDHQEMTAASLSRNARNSYDDIVSRSNAIPSTSSSAANVSLEDARYDNPVHFDYNHFDVAPNEHIDTNDNDKRNDRWKRPKRDDGRFRNFDLYESSSGFINPTFFSADERENLNAVPVYTTKDGKITYSPNPRFTYRELIMEARAKESYSSSVRDSYFARSPCDYYNCSKLRKVFKRHRDVAAGRKRDIDSTDAKPAAKHIDYSPSNNAAKTRDTSHLEFFNDANKLFANNRNSQQECKESNRKNIVDLSFLEKKYNNESASNVKHCKTKTFADNLDYEKGYNESSVFDANLFLGSKSTCEETMESIKSYSSHIDRRNTDGLKKFNFSEIFTPQKRLDLFPFLPAEQNPSDNEHKANCDTANEPMYHRAICNFIDVRDVDAQCEKLNAVLHNEQESEINNQNDATAINVNNKSANTPDASLNIQRNDEYLTKQESRAEEIKSSTVLAETPRSCSPRVADEEVQDLERDQSSASCVKDNEALAEHPDPEDDVRACNTVSSKEDKANAEETETVKNIENTENAENVKNAENVESTENAENVEITGNVENTENAEESEETEKTVRAEKAKNPKQDLDKHVKVANLSELNVDGDLIKDSNEIKSAKTIEESMPPLNEQDDGINDSAKNNSDPAVDQEILTSEISLVPNYRKEEEKVASAIELNVSTEIDQTSQTNKQDNAHDGNSTVCQEKEPIASQNPSDVALVQQSLDEKGNEQELHQPEDEEQTAKILLKDSGTDEVDNCNSISRAPSVLDLQLAQAEESVCDLFANEKREQNISEFTVIKSIIKPDKKQSQESEAKEHLKDCDSIIDSKLLCLDSSDCGIYSEDRCTLAQMSEHDFTEDDSMVPMEWETSQIQEDAVNRLCSIDESSIDFAGAASSLQDNSLLDNLSLSPASSAIKESAVPEKVMEIKSKTNDESVAAVESSVEESKPSNDDDREPHQVSSDSYEKVAYLRATDCNANMKMVPKLVIKKSEASSKFITKLSASASVPPVNSKSSYQPKIPKMIIRNARSRPGTPSIPPSIEAVHEQVSPQANISERSSLATDELHDNDSNQSSLQESSGHRNKIPKMKIKFDERHSSKIITAEGSTEICAKRKNMKKTILKESRDPDRHEERIPVLKLRKHERNRSSSPEGVTRKRQSSSHSDVPVKKYKRSGRDEAGHSSTRRSSSSDSTRTTASESEMRKNPLVCISEKIPKVIIKRTSASAEFKCEFSKGCKSVIAKSAKWQPEVKLERYRILDSMVKDLKLTLSPISLSTMEKIFSSSTDHRQQEGDHKLSRSNSTSDLLPVKCKQRRMSDYDCRKASDALKSDLSFARDLKNTKTCTTPKKNISSKNHSRPMDGCPKDDRRRSRSRDNINPQAETDTTDKEMNQPFRKTSSAYSQHDECKVSDFDVDHHEQAARVDEDRQENILVKHSNNSTDFKIALKELKATSDMENCFVKLPDLSGPLSVEINSQTEKEQDDDFFFDKSDSKNVIKKERLSSSSDIDCTLQDDIGSLKDDSAGMLDSFGIDRSSVIKIESSDESQSTIEILPASPDDNNELENNIIEDGDSEQLYSADAIPTQFELELEIADNSNTDLLDVPMPKLDPISCSSSRRVSTEEPCGDQALKAGSCNTSESSSRGKSLLEKDKHVMINNRSALESDPADSVGQVSVRSPCGRTAGSVATKEENFCCNDSLIKEVLAAKETLKKCLSKTKYEESGARLKTVAEKKQGSSFDLNSLSETHSKSSDAPQGCRSDIAPQAASTPAAGKHKTESMPDVEKSDKKHSKQSKSSCAKKKPRSPEKNDRADSREVTKNTLESTTISLKTFRRVGQAASNESRTVYLSEKRKNSADQSDTPQLRDSQQKEGSKWLSYKIPKISKSTDHSRVDGNAKENKPREDNMPILEPAIAAMDLDSDRDSSRSPPVITIQDSEDIEITAKLADEKIITSDDKVASDMKDVHKKSEMSTVDFISQLAYHEKATIKHRRYCNLCERWFPTTARHRRHLAGYQHRHIELTQRRSIHALFMLFTGKPCPRLLPAHIVRSDCSVGELTPLQIAVQDVTKCFDRREQSPKKQNDVEK